MQVSCYAFQNSLVDKLPFKLKKAAVRNRFFNYIVLLNDQKLLMNKRGPNDIWQNLYELPLFETDNFQEASAIVNGPGFQKHFGKVEISSVEGPVKHLLSHQKIHAQFIVVNKVDSSKISKQESWFFTDLTNLDALAQPKLIFAFLKKIIN